jgi:hypothetical protein
VRPELSKTRRKRSVPLSKNALEWLEAVGVKKPGRICDFSEMTLIRKRANLHEDTKVDVVKDGMRHGFGSAHLAEHGDITKSLIASGPPTQRFSSSNTIGQCRKRKRKRIGQSNPSSSRCSRPLFSG